MFPICRLLHYIFLFQVYAAGGDPDSVAGEFGRHSLYKMLGYFSLVGLLRLHSLLGDYYQAIKVRFLFVFEKLNKLNSGSALIKLKVAAYSLIRRRDNDGT